MGNNHFSTVTAIYFRLNPPAPRVSRNVFPFPPKITQPSP
jgi:hypothetical protein